MGKSEKVKKCEDDEAYESEHNVRVLEARASCSNGEDVSNESGNRISGDKASSMGYVSSISSGKSLFRSDAEGSFSIFVGSIPLLKDGYVGFLVHLDLSWIFSYPGELIFV